MSAEVMTPDECAAYLGVGPYRVRDLTTAGQIPVTWLGEPGKRRVARYYRPAIDAWLAGRTEWPKGVPSLASVTDLSTGKRRRKSASVPAPMTETGRSQPVPAAATALPPPAAVTQGA